MKIEVAFSPHKAAQFFGVFTFLIVEEAIKIFELALDAGRGPVRSDQVQKSVPRFFEQDVQMDNIEIPKRSRFRLSGRFLDHGFRFFAKLGQKVRYPFPDHLFPTPGQTSWQSADKDDADDAAKRD